MATESARKRPRFFRPGLVAAGVLFATSVAGGADVARYEVFIAAREIPREIVDGSVALKRAESRIFHGGMAGGGTSEADNAALAALVGRELLVRAAGERGIVVSEREIRDHAEGKARTFGGKEKFSKYLESAGVPWDVYVKIAGASLLASRYVDKTIAPGIDVSEEEIGNYYRENRFVYGEPSTKTFDYLVITLKGPDPSPEVESLFPRAGVPFVPSKTLPAYRRLAIETVKGAGDVSLLTGIRVVEDSRGPFWGQLAEADPGEGIFLKGVQGGRMEYRCAFITEFLEGKRVSLQDAAASIRAKVRSKKKETAVLEEVERLKAKHPVEIRAGGPEPESDR